MYFESFLPDLAAHGRLSQRWTSRKPGSTSENDASAQPVDILGQITDAFERLDGTLAALLERMHADVTLVVTSDHGNAESLRAPAHTRNPVPLLVIGPHAPRFAGVDDIAGVIQPIVALMEMRNDR